MDDAISPRLLDQRLRNRIMETVDGLTDGDAGVHEIGFTEYFESFFDFIPHRDDGGPHPNSAMTAEERELLLRLSQLVDEACDATPGTMSDDAFCRTGWPQRIQVLAQEAFETMARRGRFSEDEEEAEPSTGRARR